VHFGLMLQSQQVITNASRIGARRGTQPGGDSASIQTAVRTYCQQAGLDPTKTTVVGNISNGTSQVIVTVSYQFTSPMEGMLVAAMAIINHTAAGLGADTRTLVTPHTLQATTIMRL